MAKAELKTKKTEACVEDFFNEISDENIREDCKRISVLMEKATGAKPKMWGASIVGFGERLLKYESGRELDWMEIGFSPRKQNITLYLTTGTGWHRDLLAKLGKYKTGKGCLYVKKLSDIDESVLKQIIEKSLEHLENHTEEAKNR